MTDPQFVIGRLDYKRNKCYISRTTHIEILLNNRLSEDFQKHILPLKVMQIMTCNLKFVNRDNFITPNSISVNLLSILSALIFVVCTVNSFLSGINEDWHWNNSIFTIAEVFNLLFYNSGMLLNVALTITKSQGMVNIILKQNKIYKGLPQKRFTAVLASCWIYIAISFLLTNGISASLCILMPGSCFLYAPLTSMLFLVFDFNMYHAIFMIHWLRKAVEIWSEEFQKHSNDINDRIKQKFSLYNTYNDILETYKVVKKTTQEIILYHSIEVIRHSLLYIQTMITTCQNNATLKHRRDDGLLFPVQLMSVAAWILKNIFLQFYLAFQCEQFYIANEKAVETSVRYIKNTTEEEKQICKNVRRLHEVKCTKMSVCGFYELDVAAILQLISLLATYTIVLLQFVFL